MQENVHKMSPLMLACIYGHTTVARLLIEHSAIVDDQDDCGGTALMKAAAEGHLECCKLLIAASCIVDAEDKEGYTALLLAIQNNHLQVVEYLINAGANFSICSAEGDSPIFTSLAMGNNKIASLLLKKSTGLELKYGRHKQSLLHRVIMHCGEQTAYDNIYLLASTEGFDISVRNRMGQNAAFYAAHFNYFTVLEFFRVKGIDPFAKDRTGNSLLHFCCSSRSVAFIIDWMLEKNNSDYVVLQEINHPNSLGNTPLHIAYAFSDKDHIDLLLSKGADPQAKNKNGNTPAQMIYCSRSRLLPFYSYDKEAPHCGGILIGKLSGSIDLLCP